MTVISCGFVKKFGVRQMAAVSHLLLEKSRLGSIAICLSIKYGRVIDILAMQVESFSPSVDKALEATATKQSVHFLMAMY